jgi:hypothetical protein
MIELSSALKDIGIENYITYLNKQVERLQFYDALNRSAEGKFLIEELKTRKELARSLYSSIDATHENAKDILILIQSYEREADEWLRRITNSDKEISTILSNVTMFREMLQNRKKSSNSVVKFASDSVGTKKGS